MDLRMILYFKFLTKIMTVRNSTPKARELKIAFGDL
jgi:hypothetical protein